MYKLRTVYLPGQYERHIPPDARIPPAQPRSSADRHQHVVIGIRGDNPRLIVLPTREISDCAYHPVFCKAEWTLNPWFHRIGSPNCCISNTKPRMFAHLHIIPVCLSVYLRCLYFKLSPQATSSPPSRSLYCLRRCRANWQCPIQQNCPPVSCCGLRHKGIRSTSCAGGTWLRRGCVIVQDSGMDLRTD